MNVWKIAIENETWVSITQYVHVVTETDDINDAIAIARTNYPNGVVKSVEFIATAFK